QNGDSYDRFVQRMQEMWQSVRILEQALDQIPEGPIRSDVPLYYRPPPGEAYGHIEGSKGELGFYIVSDGGIAPFRFKIRSPSYINLTVLEEAVRGWKIADLIAIFGSFDIVMGEVDRLWRY
ncbi:MAG TPA: NADH-quinone oxidoreductase subunit D, partial [Dehalococcoidia bacterium]|nr:NADH-quinone oxidoreductase subunit D [Dehalococcoidia bacterium]